MSGNQKKSTIIKIVTSVVALLLIAGVIGFVAMFTNGFTDDFKSFYLEHNGTKIVQTETDMLFPCGEEQKFDVRYTFSDITKDKPTGYTVKIVPNVDFDFTVDGDVYSFAVEDDLTSAFDIQKNEDSFSILLPRGFTLHSVLQKLYPDSTVEVPIEILDKDWMPYSLLVTSYNNKVTYRINFTARYGANGIYLDKEVLTF